MKSKLNTKNPDAYSRAWDLIEYLAFDRISRSVLVSRVARTAMLHHQQVSNYEQGEAVPTLPHFVAWANALDYDVVLEKRRGR